MTHLIRSVQAAAVCEYVLTIIGVVSPIISQIAERDSELAHSKGDSGQQLYIAYAMLYLHMKLLLSRVAPLHPPTHNELQLPSDGRWCLSHTQPVKLRVGSDSYHHQYLGSLSSSLEDRAPLTPPILHFLAGVEAYETYLISPHHLERLLVKSARILVRQCAPYDGVSHDHPFRSIGYQQLLGLPLVIPSCFYP